MADLTDKALKYASLLLKYRLRSEKEIVDRLKRKAYPVATVSTVVDRLKAYGYLDDRIFARVFTEAHAARGVALSLKKNYIDAEGEFEKAIRLDPILIPLCLLGILVLGTKIRLHHVSGPVHAPHPRLLVFPGLFFFAG